MKHLFLALSFFIQFQSFSQTTVNLSYYLPKNTTYNPDIPTPQSTLGYVPGKWHVTHDKLVEYLKVLAESSPRISIENRGTTYEDRPLLLLTITSEKNQQNIEQLRKEHVELTENNSKTSDIENMPIVVYQGYSIHGNEPSGSNAALIAAYHLAAAQGPEIEKLLDNTIILFDPCLNPDGLQRFAYWVNIHKNKNITSDPQDREYSEVWPNGRTNHYWFDMNRDWLPAQLPESKARIATFHQWYPNILTDHHEMGTNSTFFFQPGIPSRTHPLTPTLNQQLTKKIANFHAKAFDKIGSLYYTEEDYDDFYYGKGSTFPDIHGGIGILFEQGSSRGHAQQSANGVLTFPFTIRNQFTATLSTLEAAQSMRKEILQYQKDFYNNARKEATNDIIIFGNNKDATSTHHLAEILQRHKIKFYDLKNDVTIDSKEFKKGYSYAIPKNQKQFRLIKAMFEKRTKFQDSLFYDISAWTLPLAFNLDYSEKATNTILGKEINNLTFTSMPKFEQSNYGYLLEWHEYYTPALLYALLSKNIRVKTGMTPFSLNNKTFDYGTLFIPVQNQRLNNSQLFSLLKKLSSKYHIPITNVATGLSEKGIDLGSNQFKNIGLPKIALITGKGITPYDAGEIWHLMDQRYNIPITKLTTDRLASDNLSRYTHIILPNSQRSGLSTDIAANLKKWVQHGGTIIGYRNAANFFKNHQFMKIDIKKPELTATQISFENKNKFYGSQFIGGAIFNAKIDRSHPINFGYKNNNTPLFRNTTLFVESDSQSYNNPIQYTKNPLLSGYVSKQNLDSLAKTVPFRHQKLDKGNVILFTDNTNFRAFWYGTNKLLMNAIFFSKMM